MSGPARLTAGRALRAHWPEYLIEGALLGLFMVSACSFGALLYHPASPAAIAIPDAFARGALMGLAMALTALGLLYSPWGQRSGAHMNPGVTFTFWTLGKLQTWDAIFYMLSQFAGGAAGLLLAARALNGAAAHPDVNYVATLPGAWGLSAAWIAELSISFVLMLTVLAVSNTRKLTAFTPCFAAVLLWIYITFEAPISGMSMNPARSFASALGGNYWTALWLYFTAPPIGMLLAARAYLALAGVRNVHCAKLHHVNRQRCIFNCRFNELSEPQPVQGSQS